MVNGSYCIIGFRMALCIMYVGGRHWRGVSEVMSFRVLEF